MHQPPLVTPPLPRSQSNRSWRWGVAVLTAVLAALIFASCSNSGDPTGTAADARDSSPNTEATDDGGTEVSFENDIAPIVEANCASCHTGNGPGTTHLLMETAGDIAAAAEFAAFRVDEQSMPPWPLSGLEEVAYQYDLSMSEEDRERFVDWASNGATLDVDPATTLTAANEPPPSIRSDDVFGPEEPYVSPDGIEDDYRCRVIEIDATEERWITAITVAPDVEEILHHGILLHAQKDLRAEAEALAAQDALPGWSCHTGGTNGGVGDNIAAWAPGTGPILYPEGSGLQVAPGDFFVVEWHYHHDGEPTADSSGLAVQYATDEELAAAGGELSHVVNTAYLGPAEIPCATYESGPGCERDAALARVQELYGGISAQIPAFLNADCGVTAANFEPLIDGLASSTCDMQLYDGGRVVSIWPHMHQLGTTYRLTLNPDTPEERILIDIDRWDFNLQLGYYPDEELIVTPDDTIRLECGWDRALWPANEESRYIVWADGSEDEMCYTEINTVPE